MNIFTRFASLIFAAVLLLGISPIAFAAGDYVWEEKFKKELPKAEQGNIKAQYAVGEMYEKGRGAEKDTKKAFAWFLKAAKQKNKKAAYKVGLAYLKGKGVKKDYKKARRWLKTSADKKYVRAQYYMGEIYENGRGVSKDFDEAMKWYKRALEGGYGIASEGITRVARAQKTSDQRRQAERSKPRSIPKAKPKPRPKAKVIVKRKVTTTKSKVLAGGWKKRNKAADFLPSQVTQCKDNGANIECLSSSLSRNIGMADIQYTTKAILFSFKKNGTFKISYRNNVFKITVTDAEFAASGGTVPVKLGWQDADHKLVCNFENARSLVCTKNKLRKLKFRR